MKKTIIFSVFALFSLSFIPGTDWFVFEKNNIKISFPKEPTKSVDTVDTEIGKLSIYSYMVDASEIANEENLIYSFNETKYPEGFYKASVNNPEMTLGIFRGAIDGVVTNVKGKLISEEVIAINGYPGREVKIDYNDGVAIIRMRLYLVHNNMYILQTMTLTDKDNNTSISKFMNSFKLS